MWEGGLGFERIPGADLIIESSFGNNQDTAARNLRQGH